MSTPTRFNKVGSAGRKNSKTDPYIQTYSVKITETAQGIYNISPSLPKRVQFMNAFINVLSVETTNPTATVAVGTVEKGSGTLVSANTVDTLGIKGGLSGATNSNADYDVLTYEIAVADLTIDEADVEIVVQFIGTDR